MKKKILIISISTVILISIISVIIYKQVQSRTKELATLNNNISTEEKIQEETEEENIVTNDEILENTNDTNIELTNEEEIKETKDTTTKVEQETKETSSSQTSTTQNTNENKQTETQKTNTQDSTVNTQQTQISSNEETTVKIDLSKYDRYESVNGGYIAYKKSDSEMTKLRTLIDNCISEFGYTNVKVIASNSKIENTQYFTANKTNVENKVYNSEDFIIYYYAEAEYHITSSGAESIFQYRSYIKVK